jgi:hypothetical protein
LEERTEKVLSKWWVSISNKRREGEGGAENVFRSKRDDGGDDDDHKRESSYRV